MAYPCHREGEKNSPNASVSVALTDDDRTQIQLDGEMSNTDTSWDVCRLLTINLSRYITGTAECPVYILNVVEGDVTYHCNQLRQRDVASVAYKYGCEGNQSVKMEHEDSTPSRFVGRIGGVDATVTNTTKYYVN